MIELREDPSETNTLTVQVMNCSFFVSISNSEIPDWKSEVRTLLNYFNAEFSRFQTGNELWRFNELEPNSTVVVSPMFYDLLIKAEDYRMKTEGRFSPYMLSQLGAHGYKSSFPFHSDTKERETSIQYNIEQQPLIFHEGCTITKKTANKIDLGGIAKGYAVESIANWLKTHAQTQFGIVDGGGDIRVWSNGEKTWKIGIMNPFCEYEQIGFFEMKNGGIATSNLIYRSWQQGTEKKHHILDGRTGMPVEFSIVQASIVTKNCLDAEIGAKICFMDDLNTSPLILENINQCFHYLLVKQDGSLVTGGNLA